MGGRRTNFFCLVLEKSGPRNFYFVLMWFSILSAAAMVRPIQQVVFSSILHWRYELFQFHQVKELSYKNHLGVPFIRCSKIASKCISASGRRTFRSRGYPYIWIYGYPLAALQGNHLETVLQELFNGKVGTGAADADRLGRRIARQERL